MNYTILVAFLFFVITSSLFSWSNHGLGTWISFSQVPEIFNADKIKVESLESFLEKEKTSIESLFTKNEIFYEREMAAIYPPLPEKLRFRSDSKDLVQDFLKAVRLNPESRLGYYLQDIPGVSLNLPIYPTSKVTTYSDYSFLEDSIFKKIQVGAKVTPIQVLSTAIDEPDYGMDVGLFEDNDTEVGKVYGFGIQPFGNPKYVYSAQAPFHMGFYHEGRLIYTLASFLGRTYPELRIHQFFSLSKLAFEKGHPYWGFRFAGWGMHYIQDLTQPYHSRVLPQFSTFRMIGINFLSMIGMESSKTDAVERVSNRHHYIESYQYALLKEKMLSGKLYSEDSHMRSFLSDPRDGSFAGDFFKYARDIVSKESSDRADLLDQRIEEWPEIVKAENRSVKLTNLENTKERAALDNLLNEFGQNFGYHSRTSLNWVLPPAYRKK